MTYFFAHSRLTFFVSGKIRFIKSGFKRAALYICTAFLYNLAMNGKKYRVYLGACDTYDPQPVKDIIFKALEYMTPDRPIRGKIVIKPNLVMAHPKVATESFTRSEVTEGVVTALLEKGSDITAVDVVEKSGLGVTTKTMFRHAGYKKLKKYGVKLRAMEERKRKTIVLEKGKVHTHISINKEMAQRDFLVFVPKFKTNVLSHAYSGALKLNIGTIDSKERMFQHHHKLHEKIVDILEAANPDLIITDGIRLSYGGNQMTQHSAPLGVVAVSTNAVAHDMVCARLLNLDPFKIDHIKEAIDRGYGPGSFEDIEILGDFPIEKGHEAVKDLDFGFYPVDRFPEKHPCNFTIQSGTPYCTGGCHGIFLDWLHMVNDRTPNRLKRFPRLTVLIGKVKQSVDADRVLLVGDCALASPQVNARKITRMRGCPPTHKWIVLTMMLRHFLFAPLVLPSLIWDGFGLYPMKKVKGWLANLKKRPGLDGPDHTNNSRDVRLPVCLERQQRTSGKK